MRDRTVCMMRVKNGGQWGYKSLQRTWHVASQIVVWDDGSSDNTEDEYLRSLGSLSSITNTQWGWIAESDQEQGHCTLHFLRSPFTRPDRETMRVNEIRDKNALFEVTKQLQWDYCLALDADEWLSLETIRQWGDALALMRGDVAIVHFPFVYLHDADNIMRVDGIYGGTDPHEKTLSFPRLFSVKAMSDDDLFALGFKWQGYHRSLHCGSVPRENFLVGPQRKEPKAATCRLPIVHAGYQAAEMREAKLIWYRSIDPNCDHSAEDGYWHMVGKKNRYCNGVIETVSYVDA